MSLLGPRSRNVAKLTAVLRIIFQQDNPHDAEAVVLDLVQPSAARRQFCGFAGKARRALLLLSCGAAFITGLVIAAASLFG
jgi:hypothetical protein